jgi:hypothetical protein
VRCARVLGLGSGGCSTGLAGWLREPVERRCVRGRLTVHRCASPPPPQSRSQEGAGAVAARVGSSLAHTRTPMAAPRPPTRGYTPGCPSSVVPCGQRVRPGRPRRAASRVCLVAGRLTAVRTVGAGGASTSAAPRRLCRAARPTAPRTVGAGGASRRAARRQSLKCQAVCSARAARTRRSATMRRRRSPQDTAWHPACSRARRSGAAGGAPPRVDQLTAAAMPGLLCMCTHP